MASDGARRRWCPSTYQRGRLRKQTVKAPDRVLLDSKEAAETYALAIAKKWIHEQ
jgi:hypothetical protein